MIKKEEGILLEKVLTFSYENLSGFTEDELLNCGKEFTKEEKDWIRHHLTVAQNGIKVTGSIFTLVKGSKPWKYTLSNESLFGYMDLQELKFARLSATQARSLAIAAIIISICVPLLTAFFVTQTVKIDKRQVEKLFKTLQVST